MKYILSLDQGTTSSRAILFDHAGSIIAVAQKEFPQIFPKPGWVEHNPNDIWPTQASVATEVLAKAGELAFGTVDSWLLWNLTRGKRHVTDASNASRTMLYNLKTGDWDDELLEFFSVPRSVLPEVRSSSEVYGEAEVFSTKIPIA